MSKTTKKMTKLRVKKFEELNLHYSFQSQGGARGTQWAKVVKNNETSTLYNKLLWTKTPTL